MSSMDRVNEGQSWFPVVEFFDENDDPVTPTSAVYSIGDKLSGTTMLSSTPISGLSTAVTLHITPAQNAIVNATREFEVRKLTVEFNYGADKKGVVEYVYQLINLQFAPV